jgi:hypothetical protein
MGAQLNPFAGTFCFIMSAITPPLVKHSAKFANVLAKIVPKSLRFSGAVVSRTLGKAVMPSNLPMFKGAKMTGVLLAAFVGTCVASLMTQSFTHIIVALAGLALAGGVFIVVRIEISEIARHVNYSNIGVGTSNKETIVDMVSGIVFGAILSVLLIVFSWTYMWEFSLIIVVAYFVAVVSLMKWAHGRLFVAGVDGPQKVYHLPRTALSETDEPMPEIPKPVYGVVRAAQKDFRL